MSPKISSYKYCIVPKCRNTTFTSPEKYFFSVPKVQSLRKKWCRVMKRCDKQPLSCQSSLYCCEDHFNVEADVENYIKYKLVGGRMALKSEVLPHRFDCQRVLKNTEPRSVVEKRRRIQVIENILTKSVEQRYEEHQNVCNQPIEFVSCGNTEEFKDPLYIPGDENSNPQKISKNNKGIPTH